MEKKFKLNAILLFSSIFLFIAKNNSYGGEVLIDVLVNNQNMAKELSYIYIKSVYGEASAEKQKPYKVIDKKSEWLVEGKTPDAQGGNFTIVIIKKDGQVTELIHTK
ncbi:NTF2 fold immunity protein [Rahnella sp. PD12R]|uniref:NTF2 fold immunity protein n=1 Tax=Rahnella sp. PD12R TaxID=2855688 RepID=UPI002103037D|nr:NTF2 fold immunity protein [Rahnella sp. PD12R]